MLISIAKTSQALVYFRVVIALSYFKPILSGLVKGGLLQDRAFVVSAYGEATGFLWFDYAAFGEPSGGKIQRGL